MWSSKLKRKRDEKSVDFDVTTFNQGGVRVDLLGFLFNDDRNHLINYKDNKKVWSKDLSGKVIALIFKSLDYEYNYWNSVVKNLLDLHSKLHPAGGFEIVFVAVEDQTPEYYKYRASTPRKCFLDTVSKLPFPAFIMSYEESTIIGVSPRGCELENMPLSFIIDPRDSVFINKNGSQVRFSQLVGKRIIVLSTGYDLMWDTLRELEAIYIKMKGTSDAFEVLFLVEIIPNLLHLIVTVH
ncbi:hypothetical protein POM88_011575 [Heracleum sosnowskyi]|uniref:Uncharacterized protein n=1 Tax=Heracleum sosnowskyi TaxID=360622 RepID=A0AAD8IWH2_9APIA|nr:hypothetical protein POM88_011575 [Heracleum sosnowskyi]